MGRKLFAVDLQENERGIESSRRTFHYEEFIFLGQVWGGHQLCHRDYLQLQMASSGGKTLRQDTKRSGTIRFLRKHVQMERRGFSKCWAGSSLQVYDKFVKDIVGKDFRRNNVCCGGAQWTDRALEQDDFEGVLSPMGIRWISPWRNGRGMALTVLWRFLKSCIRRFWVGTTSRAPVWTVYFCKLAVNPLRCCAYTRQIEEHAVHMCSPEERRGVCNYMQVFSPPIQELICAFCFSFERICLQGFATTMAKLVDPGDSCHREKAFRKLSLCECIVQRKEKEQKLMPPIFI